NRFGILVSLTCNELRRIFLHLHIKILPCTNAIQSGFSKVAWISGSLKFQNPNFLDGFLAVGFFTRIQQEK
ncbi:hypothetical protein, partial [Pseudoflavonifractor phocaeensis]|uniref:hypothetical protein n=1 Tax=Pseudoflavonifractor phocaeensis TaxID=1870988 RepID=UPI00195A9C26